MFAEAVYGLEQTPVSQTSRSRRAVEGLLFTATWVGLGYLFAAGDEAYLLMGIPLTVIFQTLVRRRPLRELWVRNGLATGWFAGRDVAIAAILMLAPLWWGIQMIDSGRASVIGWYGAAAAGACAAAYALKAVSSRVVLQSAVLPLAVGVAGNALLVGGIQAVSGEHIDVSQLCLSVLKWTAIYLPATFVIEEVTFRGALDSHIHRVGDTRGWSDALFVSVLWGLWHLPVSDGLPFPFLVTSLVFWHCLVGVPLSRAWRRSGNLAGPAFAHAGIDAVRNGLLGL